MEILCCVPHTGAFASALPGMAWLTVFRHKKRNMVMKAGGPFNYKSSEKFDVKKEIALKPEGVFIGLNQAFVKKMVEMLKLDNKKTKTLPHDVHLEVYNKDEVIENQRLKPDEQRQFRSEVLVCFFVAKDRPDVQQTLKTLATYMAAGTKQTMKTLRHSGTYLQGTQRLGALLPKAVGRRY